MEIAIVLFKNVVAPRLEIGDSLIIYEIIDNTINKKEEFRIFFEQPGQFVSILKQKKITLIICGSSSHFWLRMLASHGIFVMSGIMGDPDNAVKMFNEGKFKSYLPKGEFKEPHRRKRRQSKFNKRR